MEDTLCGYASTLISILFLGSIYLYGLWERCQDFLRDFNRREEAGTLRSIHDGRIEDRRQP